MKTLFLTNELRKTLESAFGTPLLGKREEVRQKLAQALVGKKLGRIITVGDHCSSFLDSDIKIFDGKVSRNKKVALQSYSLSCSNPPASIDKGVWKVLAKALKETKNVFVGGEEDLMVIPCILLAEPNDIIIYGLPKKGICLVEVSSELKKKVTAILSMFRTEKFKEIVVGGTFDRLHDGHRYLLSMAKNYGKKLVVGLCSDALVKKRKKDWKQIQSFEQREKTIKNYLKKIKIPFIVTKIEDIYGSAVDLGTIEAILLTEDTLENGKKINEVRNKGGLKELNYIILPYFLDCHNKKISSRKIRGC
ncbi:MAG: pantetheine-phosphate adenylyltransferase [bacterium]